MNEFRRFSAALFLILYALLMLKPYAPYVEYWVKKAYIMRYLCVNRDKPQMHCEGRCHLSKELQKANDDGAGNDAQKAVSPKTLENFPLFIFDHDLSENYHPHRNNYFFVSVQRISHQYCSDIPKPPPRFS